jgi:hypothetical protein
MSELNQIKRVFEGELSEEGIIKITVTVNDESNVADVVSTGKYRNDHINLRKSTPEDLNILINIMQETVKIIQQELTIVTTFIQKATDIGTSDGIIEVKVTGGVAPYTYSWSNGQETARIENLSSGTHTVDVTDFYGSTAQLIVELETL